MATESLNPLVNSQKQLKSACDLLGVEPIKAGDLLTAQQ